MQNGSWDCVNRNLCFCSQYTIEQKKSNTVLVIPRGKLYNKNNRPTGRGDVRMILISACLAGIPCRYDGGANTVPVLAELTAGGEALPVCPEVLGGLPTPRIPSERLPDGRVVNAAGEDLTEAFRLGRGASPGALSDSRLQLRRTQSPQPLLRQGRHLRRKLHPHPSPRRRRLRRPAPGKRRPDPDRRGIPEHTSTIGGKHHDTDGTN